jgi:hypothetical protein
MEVELRRKEEWVGKQKTPEQFMNWLLRKKYLWHLDSYNSCKVYITYDIFWWRPCK